MASGQSLVWRLARLVQLVLGSRSAMGTPWVCRRPNNKASGCSQETGEHPLEQWYPAALPEGQDGGGIPTALPEQRGGVGTLGQWPASRRR